MKEKTSTHELKDPPKKKASKQAHTHRQNKTLWSQRVFSPPVRFRVWDLGFILRVQGLGCSSRATTHPNLNPPNQLDEVL